jgi:hypothetical protein
LASRVSGASKEKSPRFVAMRNMVVRALAGVNI